MRIALFGATGATGAHFLRLALEKDHEVVALVRSPEKIKIESKNILKKKKLHFIYLA